VIVVIDRRQAQRIVLILVLLVVAGLLYVVSSRERASLMAKGEQLSTPARAPATREPDTVAQVPGAAVRVTALPDSRFDDYRVERDRARAAQVELLRGALAESGLSEARKEQLTGELLELLRKAEREMQAEALLKAQGFADAVVVITDSAASAVVSEVLTSASAAKVGDLVARIAGISPERITIIDGA
jgi:hypothetical protein